MDQSAILQIQQAQATAEVNVQLTTKTAGSVIAIPRDFSIESLEKFNETRDQFRGAFTTQSPKDFLDYANALACGSCFIDAEKMSAKAFFDIGESGVPGHCLHTSTLQLEKTNAFEAFTKIDGEKISQKAIVEWLEDWSNNITVRADDGSTMIASAAIAAVRRINIKATATSFHEEKDFGQSRSAMEEVEATSSEKMPAWIEFDCVPYQGLEARDFIMRVGIMTGEEKPEFKLRIVQLGEAKEEMAQEFKDLLTKDLTDAIASYVGTFRP